MRFFDAVVHYETELWTGADRALRAAGTVSLADLEGLRAIDGAAAPARVHDVSDTLGITVGAASKLVDRLTRAGFVERRANPEDGRSSLLVVTAAGAAALEAAQGELGAWMAAHLAEADVDIDALTAGLEALRAALRAGRR